MKFNVKGSTIKAIAQLTVDVNVNDAVVLILSGNTDTFKELGLTIGDINRKLMNFKHLVSNKYSENSSQYREINYIIDMLLQYYSSYVLIHHSVMYKFIDEHILNVINVVNNVWVPLHLVKLNKDTDLSDFLSGGIDNLNTIQHINEFKYEIKEFPDTMHSIFRVKREKLFKLRATVTDKGYLDLIDMYINYINQLIECDDDIVYYSLYTKNAEDGNEFLFECI